MSSPTLTQWLRARDDTALVALLRARPDLTTPTPANTTVLAGRAASRASVTRACDGLDTFTLTVLDALLVLDADTHPVPRSRLAELLGAEVPAERVCAALAGLRALALAWGEDDQPDGDDATSVVPAAREASGEFPGGLGRPSPALDGRDLPAVLAQLSESEHRLLATLANGQPIGRTKDASVDVPAEAATTPVQRLLGLGLLVRRDHETVELPRQVGLALRGAHPMGPVRFAPPVPRTTTREMSVVDAAGAGEAMAVVRHVEALLSLWSETPPPVLRSGGLGVRELRRVARELDVDERHATLVVELASGANLITDTETTAPEWLPTVLADTWLAAGQAQRWATLAGAWLDLPRLPGLVGLRDAKEKVITPLSAELRRPLAAAARRRVLAVLAERDPGTGIEDPAEVAALLAWYAPRRGGRLRDETVHWTVAEAAALGVVALGTLTTPARALLDEGQAPAAQRMAEAMPAPLDHVLIQADLTIVAPGPLEPMLAAEIALAADVESAGSATVYRVSAASIRRALDAGRTATELHELFRTRSRTPVPQSLSYLVDDVARKHGRLRGGVASSFLRCDDQVLLAEVAASRVAADLGLRLIAPTVLVSPIPLAHLLDELRAAGFTPIAEGPDGHVLDLRPPGPRAPITRRAPQAIAVPKPPTDDRLAELVRHLRSADRAADSRLGRTVSLAAGAGADTTATLALLKEAAQDGRSVWIGFVDANGTASQRIVEPIRVGGGILDGRDPTHDEVHRFPLHRITSAALVED